MSPRLIVASVSVLVLGLASPSLAQPFTLNGAEVPSDQVERLQAHCDALEAAEMGSSADAGSATGTSSGTGAATGGAAASSTGTTSSAATDTTTGSGTDSPAGATSDAAGATSGTTQSTDAAGTTTGADATTGTSAMIDFSTIDMAAIDIEACRQGGFLDMTGAGTGADAGSTTTNETTTN
ncbi:MULTISPECIES: hypothetical protein [Devosia]|uniref:hypothetical protein n=1 Tax=Devosia TaxID=46913 RepID=UPI002733DC19|nr:hypothetical protein [Devosia sp.]MDP2782729.1 hypothetical protein [Devosia sp.]